MEYSVLKCAGLSRIYQISVDQDLLSCIPLLNALQQIYYHLLTAFSPSFLPSQFEFLSVRDALPQVRSWLGLCRQGLGPSRCLSCRQIPGWPLVGSPVQKAIYPSSLQDQALGVQTALFSSLWFLGIAARFVTPGEILQGWQHRSVEGEMDRKRARVLGLSSQVCF